jgi:hypothetical protein
VRQWLAQQQAETNANYMACHMMFGTMPKEDAMRSIELFGREVMPAFASAAVA